MSIIKDIYNDSIDDPEVTLTVTTLAQTEDVAVVRVEASINGLDFFEATASSRRDPSDPIDAEVGIKLATGRAIRKLGREILKDGQAGVRENERVRRTQAEAAERARAKKQKSDDYCCSWCNDN